MKDCKIYENVSDTQWNVTNSDQQAERLFWISDEPELKNIIIQKIFLTHNSF
jgi:hypothetical protein